MFNMKPRWNFPSNDYGQISGIADSGVETFKGTPIKSLAREICQNSLDASLKNGKPTYIEFKTFEIAPTAIPGNAGFEDALKRSVDFWSLQRSSKAKNFFKAALKTMKSSSITCLRISDHNTAGLTGSREEYNSAWCNLTKSSGVSDKSGSNGGSFGIGKFAPYASSALRTVFYSTYDINGLAASQGVARLASFKNGRNQITQGIGFYGNEKNSPMYQQFSLDSEYSRGTGDTGTDIYVAAFTGDDDWKKQMIASILDGFLYAVYSGTLVIDVDGIKISKNTLPDLIKTYKDDFKEHADEYYQTLTDEKAARTFTKEFTDDAETTGKLTLKLMIKPGFSRRAAMIRETGMKIKDKGNISALIPFAGTLFIEGDAINAYLRNLENPQHLEWEVERAYNKNKARNLLTAMNHFIKNSLNEMKNDESEDALDPTVGEYLSANESEDTDNQERTDALQDNIREISVHVSERVAKPSEFKSGVHEQLPIDSEDGEINVTDVPGDNGSGSLGHGGNGGDGGGANPGNGGGNTPSEHSKKLSAVSAVSIRSVVRNKAQGEYTIVFTPKSSAANGVLEIFMSAESQDYEAPIITAVCSECPDLRVSKNKIMNLTFTEKKTLRFDIKLDYHDYCSLEVTAYGNQV